MRVQRRFNWARRWLVVAPLALVYYKEQGVGPHIGRLNLEDGFEIWNCNHPGRFFIKTEERTLFFWPEVEDEDWLEALYYSAGFQRETKPVKEVLHLHD